MIYNLSKYVSDNTTLTPITNGYDASITGDSLYLAQTGGDDKSRGLKVDYTVQFISKASIRDEAYKVVTEVHNLLKNRFGISFPAVTVGGITYPLVEVSQILPIQTPGYLGVDNNGLHQWSVNYQITIRED